MIAYSAVTFGGSTWRHDANSNHQDPLENALPIEERTVVEGQLEPRVGRRPLVGGRKVPLTVDRNT